MADVGKLKVKVVPEIKHLKEDLDELQTLLSEVSKKVEEIYSKEYLLSIKTEPLSQ